MTPKSLMIMGAFGAVLTSIGTLVVSAEEFVVVSFAAGAVFGKGYGVHEILSTSGKTSE